MDLKDGDWVTETLIKGWRQQIQIKKVLATEKTPYQDLAVFESHSLGNVMLIDDRVQLTLRDESAYHEMFAHVPIIAHGRVKNLLIIGGGDGATLREVLKHKNIRATLVDIDGRVIEFSKAHLLSLHQGAWSNPNVEVIIADGTVFVQETTNKYDVILIDSTDPEEGGPSHVLFQKEFYANCKKCLTPGGVLITQSGHPQWETYPVVALAELAKVFENVTLYHFCVPTYLGGVQTLGWACDDPSLLSITVDEIASRWEKASIMNVQHYTPAFHKGSFMLPLWVEKLAHQAIDAAKKDSPEKTL